jgi:acetylornithine deacetylase/succinyl-diaminopimelate desuccinylase-like protein
MTASHARTLEQDVLDLCRGLIRIDTTNTGEADSTVGEAAAAEYVEGVLREAGYEPERFTTTGSTRQGVHLRIPGRDPALPALLVHGHLDVVPAVARDWQVDPFAAEVADGMVWGRGAVDMKDMDAMLLAVVRQWARTGYRPPRDIVLVLTPDEEAGGVQGAHWLVDHRPELFRGVTDAIGEVGGFSLTVAERRCYLLQVAEKGIAWLRLTARGRAGHGSMVNDENAVVRLAEALVALDRAELPLAPTATTEAFVAHLSAALEEEFRIADPAPLLAALGPAARMVAPGFRNTVAPTMLQAGLKVNVVPGEASATVDGRFLPGQEQALLDAVARIVGPHVEVTVLHRDVAVETPFAGPVVADIASALRAEDPAARIVPYLMSGGTDGKAFSRLGIRCYGFAPLRLPPELDFASLFHGVDERVPVAALEFGARVLDRFLRSAPGEPAAIDPDEGRGGGAGRLFP